MYTHIAAALFNFCLVPNFDTMNLEDTEYVFKKTNAATLFVSKKHIKEIVDLINSNNASYACIKNIVALNDELITDEDVKMLDSITNKSVRWIRFSKIVETGEKRGILA